METMNGLEIDAVGFTGDGDPASDEDRAVWWLGGVWSPSGLLLYEGEARASKELALEDARDYAARLSASEEWAIAECGHECIYCGRRVPGTDDDPVPAVGDEDAWQALAAQHANGCEWVYTRAHRINVA